MDAVMVIPGRAGTARLEDIAEPDPALGSVVVQALAVGVCGTDVLNNLVVFGSVNANRRHYCRAAKALARRQRLVGGSDHLSRRPRPV